MSTNRRSKARRMDDWREANAEFLAEGIEWVVLLLDRRAEAVRRATPTQAAPAATRGLLARLIPVTRARRAAPPDTPAVVPPVGDAVSKAKAKMEAAASRCEAGPALWLLARQFGLDGFEAAVVLLLAAMELDARVGVLCGRALGTPGAPYPTFALALTLFDDAYWSAFSPDQALRAWRLVELQGVGPASPMIASPLRLDERVLNFLKGIGHLDERLAAVLPPLDPAAVPPLAASQEARVDEVVEHWEDARDSHAGPVVVQLVGGDPDGKWQVARRTAARVGRALYRLPAENLIGNPVDLDTLAKIWERETKLWPVALYVDVEEAGGADPEHPDAQESARKSAAVRFLSRGRSHAFLAAADPVSRLARASVLVEVAKPTPVEQVEAWSRSLGLVAQPELTAGEGQPPAAEGQPPSVRGETPARPSVAPDLPARLVSQFNLDRTTIQGLARRVAIPATGDDATPAAPGQIDANGESLWSLCRKATRPKLDGLAQRVDAKATWDDLVLPGRAQGLLRRVAAQARRRYQVHSDWGFAERSERGLGISVLFAGESGTGKTMAAEILANELKVDLYRVDASAVISKFIGQTEKLLRRVLDSFEDCGAVVMFDEADSLFSKRTDIKDSHDRYANQEVNYLLQRLEAYRGVAILATNFQSAIEPAFLRRLRYTIEFLPPGASERIRLWRGIFPRGVPLGSIDYEALAELPINGGAIRSIALNACFAAAEAGGRLEMAHIWEAARDEMMKLGRPVPAVIGRASSRPGWPAEQRAIEGAAS